MAHLIGVEVVTPEAKLFAGVAMALVTKTSDGDLTVMAEHAELIGDVVPGITKIEFAEGEPMDVVVHGGFLQVHTEDGSADDLFSAAELEAPAGRVTRVTLLAGLAEKVVDLKPEEVDADLATFEAEVDRLSGLAKGGEEAAASVQFDLDQASAALDRARLRKQALSA